MAYRLFVFSAHRLTILNVDDAVKEAVEAFNNNELILPPSEPQPPAEEPGGCILNLLNYRSINFTTIVANMLRLIYS